MLRALQSLSQRVIRQCAPVSGRRWIAAGDLHADVARVLASVRFLSSVAFRDRSAAFVAEHHTWHYDSWSVGCRLSSTASVPFSESASNALIILTAFLSNDRMHQLKSRGLEAQLEAALKAVTCVPALHPSRLLVERLIADPAACPFMWNEWKKLVDNSANWENLAATLAKDGEREVAAVLERMSLSIGTARAVTGVLAVAMTQQKLALARHPGYTSENVNGLDLINLDRATPPVFVDYFGAHEAVDAWAERLHKPALIVGAIKSGKSVILNHFIPAAVQRWHPAAGYVPLCVDWSNLRSSLNYPELHRRFQLGINTALARVGLPSAKIIPDADMKLVPFLEDVERICVAASCRPLHLWDEAEYLFRFDRPGAVALFDALRHFVYRSPRDGHSRFALTGTASYMLLRVIAQQHPSGTDPFSNTTWIVIPSPDAASKDQCTTIRAACDRALQCYYKSLPVAGIAGTRVTVENADPLYAKNGDVLTPAIAVTLASMVDENRALPAAVEELNQKMDAEWIVEALQTLWVLPQEDRRQLRLLASAAPGAIVSLDFIATIPFFNAARAAIFHVNADGKTGRMVPRYAHRVLRAVTADGELNVSSFQYARAGIAFNLSARVALVQSFGWLMLQHVDLPGSPVRRLAEEALARYLDVDEPCDPLSLPWLCELRDMLSATESYPVVTAALQRIAGEAHPEDIAFITVRMVRILLLYFGPAGTVPFADRWHANKVMNFVEGFSCAVMKEWVRNPPAAGVDIEKEMELWEIV